MLLKLYMQKKLFVYVVQQLSSQENEMKIILIGMLGVKDVNRMKAKKHYIIILILQENIKIMMILIKSGKIGTVKLRM